MKKLILVCFLLVVVVVILVGYSFYSRIYSNNINPDLKKSFYLYVPTGADFTTVIDSLEKNNILKDIDDFRWLSEKKNYTEKIRSGRYKIDKGMTNNSLVNMLRAGRQKALKLTFNNVRKQTDLAKKIAAQIEADSASLMQLFSNKEFLRKYGFTPSTVISMFIPNTYEFYWNTSADKFFDKMNKEYKKFWTQKRKHRAKTLNMSLLEVSVLASIVQAEQSRHNSEKAKIAGLYINRLNKGMALESDPTLIYAWGDFSIKRVLNKHKEIKSPYNTYKNLGLPPAPINLPEISSIDAVLNYEKHNYIFMCAKEDFSGYHNFSTNLTKHNIYARRYHRALNKRKIMK